MINKPERMSMAHILDIESGEQRHISEYVELDRKEVALSARRVHKALKKHRKNEKGGEKI